MFPPSQLQVPDVSQAPDVTLLEVTQVLPWSWSRNPDPGPTRICLAAGPSGAVWILGTPRAGQAVPQWEGPVKPLQGGPEGGGGLQGARGALGAVGGPRPDPLGTAELGLGPRAPPQEMSTPETQLPPGRSDLTSTQRTGREGWLWHLGVLLAHGRAGQAPSGCWSCPAPGCWGRPPDTLPAPHWCLGLGPRGAWWFVVAGGTPTPALLKKQKQQPPASRPLGWPG